MRPHYKTKYNWQSNQPDWYFYMLLHYTWLSSQLALSHICCHDVCKTQVNKQTGPCRYWSWHVTSCLHYKLLTSQSWMKWGFIAINLQQSSRVRSACSGAPWVRKCGKLPIRENLVIMWLYTGRPPNRPSTPQVSQCKITHSTGMATQM